MPQITLEHTANILDTLDFKTVLLAIHQTVHDVTGVNIENCKSRARQLEYYLVGSGGSEKAFVGVDLYLLEGRSDDIKRALGQAVLDLLTTFFPQSIAKLDLQITVKVDDICKDYYFKYAAPQ